MSQVPEFCFNICLCFEDTLVGLQSLCDFLLHVKVIWEVLDQVQRILLLALEVQEFYQLWVHSLSYRFPFTLFVDKTTSQQLTAGIPLLYCGLLDVLLLTVRFYPSSKNYTWHVLSPSVESLGNINNRASWSTLCKSAHTLHRNFYRFHVQKCNVNYHFHFLLQLWSQPCGNLTSIIHSSNQSDISKQSRAQNCFWVAFPRTPRSGHVL